MATCSFGASPIKFSKLDLGSSTIKVGTLLQLRGLKFRKNVGYDGLILSQRSKKILIGCRCSDEGQCLFTVNTTAQIHFDGGFEGNESSCSRSHLIPKALEVETLLKGICDTTSIAEFELKLGGFHLYVARDLSGKNEIPLLPVFAPVSNTTVAAPEPNGSTSSTSLTIAEPVLTSGGIQSFVDTAANDGLVILQSPRVGYFRRCRTIKGKRAPPSCNEKQTVKEGQVLCFVQQLGGEIPVESDASGEVVKILLEDGDPVGYGDALIAILPSLPGIKKLQ